MTAAPLKMPPFQDKPTPEEIKSLSAAGIFPEVIRARRKPAQRKSFTGTARRGRS